MAARWCRTVSLVRRAPPLRRALSGGVSQCRHPHGCGRGCAVPDPPERMNGRGGGACGCSLATLQAENAGRESFPYRHHVEAAEFMRARHTRRGGCRRGGASRGRWSWRLGGVDFFRRPAVSASMATTWGEGWGGVDAGAALMLGRRAALRGRGRATAGVGQFLPAIGGDQKQAWPRLRRARTPVRERRAGADGAPLPVQTRHIARRPGGSNEGGTLQRATGRPVRRRRRRHYRRHHHRHHHYHRRGARKRQSPPARRRWERV